MQFDHSYDPSDAMTLTPLAEEVTYGAVVDIRNVEHEITELMIRRACEQMDPQQQFPFCSQGSCHRRPRMRRAG